jgi:hypothetical protein
MIVLLIDATSGPSSEISFLKAELRDAVDL